MNKIRCNRCGRSIEADTEMAREDYLHVKKQWGYFSKRDGRTQEFNLCEACVKLIEQDFVIAPWEYETRELL